MVRMSPKILSKHPVGRLACTVGLLEASKTLGTTPPVLRRWLMGREPVPDGAEAMAVLTLRQLWAGREVPDLCHAGSIDGGPP